MFFEISNKPIGWRIEESLHRLNSVDFILKMGLETDVNYYILNNKSFLLFNKKDTDTIIRFECLPIRRLIKNSDKIIEFILPLSLDMFKEIEDIRHGENLEARLHIDEMFLISNQTPEKPNPSRANQTGTKPYFYRYSNQESNLLVEYDVTKIKDSSIIIYREDWSKVIRSIGMGERIIIEVPFKLPDLDGIAYDDGELLKLKKNLEKSIEKLVSTYEEYLIKHDDDKCIFNIRGASELLYKLPHKDNAKHQNFIKKYKEFLFEKSGTGSKEISEEVILNIFSIIDAIFSISSKSVHEIDRKSESTFEFYPKEEDAELLLGTYALICSWMSHKFERAALKSLSSPFIDENLISSLDWIKEQISSEDRIFSWWYYGNKISGYSNKDVCISFPSENIEDILKKPISPYHLIRSQNREAKDVAEALLAIDPRETSEIMRSQDSKYIFIHKDDITMLEEIYAAARKPFPQGKIDRIDLIKESFLGKALRNEDLRGFEKVYNDSIVFIYKTII